MTVTKIKPGNGRKASKKFYAIWRDAAGQRFRVPLYPNERASRVAAQRIEDMIALKAAKAQLPVDLAAWVESMDTDLRDRLAAAGVLSPAAVAASKPLDEHLADWQAALTAKGNTA